MVSIEEVFSMQCCVVGENLLLSLSLLPPLSLIPSSLLSFVSLTHFLTPLSPSPSFPLSLPLPFLSLPLL